eukprot:TRINITY_DN2590_c0_g1_i1.p1 TRINITY_DN2590_c0_g1~~TRINITY_DN2590_c0_g1_i1.p1  ORF type:complete len:239 (+),score=63.85 TRINITY_DN2590_c0_g1_i1:112-828(+)
MLRSLVGSEMCIRDRWYQRRVRGVQLEDMSANLLAVALLVAGAAARGTVQGRYQESVYSSEMMLCVNGSELAGWYGTKSKDGSISGTLEGTMKGTTATGHWTERHQHGRQAMVFTGGFEWRLGSGQWGGVFSQMGDDGTEKRFAWTGKRIESSDEEWQQIGEQCIQAFHDPGFTMSKLGDTLYQMVYWRSLGLPPPNVAHVAAAGMVLVSTVFVATAVYLVANNSFEGERRHFGQPMR